MSYTKRNPNGQATKANSAPVVLASDQDALPITDNGGSLTVDAASLPLPTGASTSALQTTGNTSLATIAALSKVEDAAHTTGDTGIPMWAVRNDTGAVFAGSDGDYIPFATDATGALRVDLNGVISTNNSTSSVLSGGAAFTGTSEDVLNYNEIRISVIASHASATDGLSIQQSSDNSNWDVTDTYTIPAATSKTYSVPRQARYFRVVYTNGATLQTSFRLQTILNRLGARVSSQRPNDGYSNETDLEQAQSFNMGYNGTTWDRLRSDTTNGLDVDVTRLSSLVAGSAIIGKVGIDQTTPGTTNGVQVNAALPAGANAIGKLAANSGVDIGDVDVTTVGTITPGTAATSLGKAEDAAHASGDVGVFALGVRNDGAATSFTSANGDYNPVATDAQGRIYVIQKAPTATLSNVSSSATNVTILAANTGRIGAQFYNDSTTVLYLKFGTTASATSFTVPLAAATYYELPGGYTGNIDGIWASANGTCRVTELT